MNFLKGTNENFLSLIKEGLTIVFFTKPDDEDCKATRVNLEVLQKEIGSAIKIVEVNINEERKINRRFPIGLFPTITLFKNGKVLKSKVKRQSTSQLAQFLNGYY